MQNVKHAHVILPQSIGTTEVTGNLDCKGFKYATIIFALDTAAASSVITTASLAEGATTSSVTAIATFEGGDTTDGYTLPVPQTSTGDIIAYNVDLRKRKRYLQVGFASTTARLAAVTAVLSRADIAPNSNTEAGATRVIG